MKYILIGLLLFFISCNNKKNIPEVSKIKIDLSVHRFDQDFFSIDTTNYASAIESLQKKYPAFLPLYFEYFSPVDFIVRQQGKTYDTAVAEYFRTIKPLYNSVQEKYKNISSVEDGLQENLRYVKYFFPSFKTPVVVTSVESLNPENPMEIYGTTYYHDTLIISLQMFLGKDFPVYDPSQYPDYIRRRFEPEYIVPNCFRSIALDLYADSSQGFSLIEQMIEKGKQWYLMSKFLPETPDSLITGFTKHQMEWCLKEEGNTWGYLNQNENLFSIESSTIQMYLGEAPFTQTLPHGKAGEGAPGNIGQWIGWRIIEAYAEKNPKLTLQQILSTPAKKLFQEAGYRPK